MFPRNPRGHGATVSGMLLAWLVHRELIERGLMKGIYRSKLLIVNTGEERKCTNWCGSTAHL